MKENSNSKVLNVLIDAIEKYEDYKMNNQEPKEKEVDFLKAYIYGITLQLDKKYTKNEDETFEIYLERIKKINLQLRNELYSDKCELVTTIIEDFKEKKKSNEAFIYIEL